LVTAIPGLRKKADPMVRPLEIPRRWSSGPVEAAADAAPLGSDADAHQAAVMERTLRRLKYGP
jgi:hypothetical protein